MFVFLIIYTVSTTRVQISPRNTRVTNKGKATLIKNIAANINDCAQKTNDLYLLNKEIRRTIRTNVTSMEKIFKDAISPITKEDDGTRDQIDTDDDLGTEIIEHTISHEKQSSSAIEKTLSMTASDQNICRLMTLLDLNTDENPLTDSRSSTELHPENLIADDSFLTNFNHLTESHPGIVKGKVSSSDSEQSDESIEDIFAQVDVSKLITKFETHLESLNAKKNHFSKLERSTDEKTCKEFKSGHNSVCKDDDQNHSLLAKNIKDIVSQEPLFGCIMHMKNYNPGSSLDSDFETISENADMVENQHLNTIAKVSTWDKKLNESFLKTMLETSVGILRSIHSNENANLSSFSKLRSGFSVYLEFFRITADQCISQELGSKKMLTWSSDDFSEKSTIKIPNQTLVLTNIPSLKLKSKRRRNVCHGQINRLIPTAILLVVATSLITRYFTLPNEPQSATCDYLSPLAKDYHVDDILPVVDDEIIEDTVQFESLSSSVNYDFDVFPTTEKVYKNFGESLRIAVEAFLFEN